MGDDNKSRLSDTSFTNQIESKLNPFDDIPEGLKSFSDCTPYIVEGKKSLVIGDLHSPYYDRDALICSLEAGGEAKVDTVILNGDLIDCYELSRFEKDPRNRGFKEEINHTIKLLQQIRKIFPRAHIIFKIGNHDNRLERYLRVKAPELLGFEVMQIGNLLRCDEMCITVLDSSRTMKIGSLNVLHGHEFGKTMSSPVNPARGLYNKGKENALCSHFHRTSQHSEKTMNDTVISCWSIGCLSELSPEYLRFNSWNHGFAIVERDKEEFRVNNFKIIDRKIYPG